MGTYDNARADRATRGSPSPAVFKFVWLPLLLCRLGLLLCAGALAAEHPGEAAPPAIRLLPGDGMNLHIVEQINPHYVVVKVDPPVHNWFAGAFTNLPTDGEVTLGLSMQGMDTPDNKANVSKWRGLRPVMTYADPTKYETYEWYQKDDQGRWVSGDPFKQGEAKFAGTGTVPAQTAIPAELAAHFLSKDGKYWQPWREVDYAEAVTSLNIFRIKQRFAQATATVAMRVPYTYTYQQQLLGRLRAAKLPGVFVDEIGKTVQGRTLQVIRIEDPDSVTPIRIFGYRKSLHPEKIPIVWVDYTLDKHVTDDYKAHLITAREHATEHASSWVVLGMVHALLGGSEGAKTLRKETTWLLIPIQDPDGSIVSSFDTMTDQFWQHSTYPANNNPPPIEVLAYANYLRAFINTDRPIATAVAWHNVECNEGEHVFAPFITFHHEANSVALNLQWFTTLQHEGYITGNPNGNDLDYMRLRLYGWCGSVYHAMSIAYEVNDRFAQQRLDSNGLENIGGSFANTLSQYYRTEIGKRHLAELKSLLHQRRQALEQHYALVAQRRQQALERHYASEERFSSWDDPSIAELLTSGY